ncbi:MAG: SIR2 family protein [Chloroflexota bacterium]
MTVEIYTPKKVGEEITANTDLLITWLAHHRVTFLLGAGASHGSPTELPLAPELAERLYHKFRDGFAAAALRSVDQTDLLAVADAIAGASPEGTRLLQRTLGDLYPFDSAEPNHGHRVLALLFAEGLINVALSTNYDCCVERAAEHLAVPIRACADASEMQRGRNQGRLLKLHGCITKEESIHLTQAQLENPPDWARAEVMVGTASGAFVVVGIGSVAPYIRTTLQSILQYANEAESIWIVSPEIADDWDQILSAGNKANKVTLTSEEFFDDLLRSCVHSQLTELLGKASKLTLPGEDSLKLQSAADQLAAAVRETDAESIVLYLRKGAVPSRCSLPLATGALAIRVMLALSMIQAALGETPQIERIGNEVALRLDGAYIEFALCHDSRTSSEVCELTNQRLKRARTCGVIKDPTKPTLVVSYGHIGALPSNVAPSNIVDARSADDLIDGPNITRDTWLDLSDITNAPSVEKVRERVMEALS